MGYDRIVYFEGKDNTSTLISADKQSAQVVYGINFRIFCGRLGFKVRQVVDVADVPDNISAINRGVEIDTLPNRTKAEVIPGYRVARGVFVELQPPVDGDMTRILNAYFESHCEPSDAGLILDYRLTPTREIGEY